MLAFLFASAVSHANDAANAAAGAGVGILMLVLIVVGTIIYFIPTFIAFKRKRSNAVAIFALNFFLGWCLIGWVVSLVWALSSDQAQPQQIIVQNYNGPAPAQPTYTQPPSAPSSRSVSTAIEPTETA